MNRLVIIGNGFDIAHGLKTSYMDFINWYWEQTLNSLTMEHTPRYRDCLCELKIIKTEDCHDWFYFFLSHSLRNPIDRSWKQSPAEIIQAIKENSEDFSVTFTPFFETILQSIETKGWVDIEQDYYHMLKWSVESPQCTFKVSDLNNQLKYLQDKLIEYLRTLESVQCNSKLNDAIIDYLYPADFSTEGRKKAIENIGLDISDIEKACKNFKERNELIPEQIMMLSFNYTDTARKYENFNLTHNYIHGELANPKNIIFGYGDELDKDYQKLLDRNENELLRYVKSVKYLETGHYRKLLEFIQSAPFQVYIMGHSCGSSDRTLLNTVFEHENCVSIKPFFHKLNDGSDNYLELVQNISRNFTDMKLFRDRVVNKEQCETM